jgi:hypothetical protein
MDGDVDLEEAHRIREAGMPCVHSPRIPLGSRRSGSPGEQPASENFKNFKSSQLIILAASSHYYEPIIYGMTEGWGQGESF